MRAPQLHGGAVGTELARRGFPVVAPLWSAAANLEAPELVATIHREYAAAGAALVTANTTCAHEHVVGDAMAQVCRVAIALARRSGARVAASLAMLPATIDPSERTARYRRAAAAMGDADVLLLEGFVDPGELGRAVAATRAWTGPRWAALAGSGVAQLHELVGGLADVELFAVHCCRIDEADAALGRARARAPHAPLGCYPSPTADTDDDGFARALADCARRHGLRWVGSCCGSTPATTAAIARAIAG